MNKKVLVDFPDRFYENLRTSLKKEKAFLDHTRDWLPIIISTGMLVMIIWVSCIIPRKQEVDLEIHINWPINIRLAAGQSDVELLIIPLKVYNHGNAVILRQYADIVFVEDSGNRFSIRSLFQGRDNLRVRPNDDGEFVLNATNRSFPSLMETRSFRDLLGKVKVQVEVTVRDRTTSSGPVEFSSPHVIFAE